MPNANAAKNRKYAVNARSTMSAGTSMSQKRMGLLIVALIVGLWAAVPTSQTGQVMPPPKFVAYDGNGDPCSGCKLYVYLAGTTTPTDSYTSSALSTPNANPVVLDSAGRATVFISPTVSYKFVLKTSAEVDIYTVDNVVGPFSGVVSVTAANTRGIQVSRAGADAGISIASTGGSGKTYGIVSNTSGAFILRDDADGTPNITISGNDVTTTATGTVATAGNQTVSGTLAVTGASTLASLAVANAATVGTTLGVTGVTSLSAALRVAGGYSAAPAAVANGMVLGGQSATDRAQIIFGDGTGYNFHIGTVSGGAFAPRVTLTDTGVLSVTGRINSATTQPGFLAYNSALDGVATGGTLDFDTEVFDDGNNFASDMFTAPVTGRYHLCITTTYSDNSASTYGLRLVTTARTYQIDASGSSSSGVSSGCVYVDMAASATAYVQVLTGDLDVDIDGGASPLLSFFSGRLVP